MAKCLENSDCNKMVGNRSIHGFSVKREKGKFIIEMPFGQNGIGKSFEVEDLHNDYDAGRFYMNFGNYEDATHTYIIQGYISDHSGGHRPTNEIVKIANNENAKKSYEENDEGMPLYTAQHLWMLGMDILGTVEQQKLFFFTKGVPNTIKITTCEKNDTNLTIHREYFKKFINAMYLMPNAKDVRRPLENMHEQEIREAKPAPKDLIIVGEKEHIEELPNALPNIEFFLSGWVPENAANFSILLYHGMKELVEEFGQKVMEIFVTFDGKNIKECKVTSFLSINLTQSCIINDQEKPVAFKPGEKFWLWIKIHDEKLEISLNCNQRTFEIGIIPYSSENYIKFSGDLDLVINQQQDNVSLATEIKSGENNLTEKSPVLLVQKMDNSLNVSKLIMIEAKSVIMDTNTNVTNKKIEIKFAETKIQNFISGSVFEFENCRPKNLTQCDGSCMNVTFYDNMENKSPPPFCLDSRETLFNFSSETTFNFVLLCNELNNTANKSDPISGLIEMQAFLNQKKIIDITATKCKADYLQVKGDLEYPINVNMLEFVYKYSAIATTYSYKADKNDFHNAYLAPNKYVILHFLWLGKMDDYNDKKVTIGFTCQNCIKNSLLRETSFLTLELNFEEMLLNATSSQIINGKTNIVENKTTNIAPKNSFWLKIEQTSIQEDDKSDEEINVYEIYQNDEIIMEIESEKEKNPTINTNTLIDAYNINGSIALFNNPYVVFPYQFSLKKNIFMAENYIVTMKWRIMENAEFIEFFLAKGSNVGNVGTKFKNNRKFDKFF